MPAKCKITFAIHSSLKHELRERIIKDGYGLREKSKWLSEAVESLFTIKNFPRLISYNDEMCNFDQMETASIDYALKLKIDESIIQIRKEFPTLEGLRSRIMRTAILQRILRS